MGIVGERMSAGIGRSENAVVELKQQVEEEYKRVGLTELLGKYSVEVCDLYHPP